MKLNSGAHWSIHRGDVEHSTNNNIEGIIFYTLDLPAIRRFVSLFSIRTLTVHKNVLEWNTLDLLMFVSPFCRKFIKDTN